MSSQDFPGPSWQDAEASDDRRSGYRRASDDGYGQPRSAGLPDSRQYGYDASQPRHGNGGRASNGYGPAGPPDDRRGSVSYGSNGNDRADYGRSDYRGNGGGYSPGGRDAAYGGNGNGYPGNGDGPGRRRPGYRAAGGRHGSRNGAEAGRGQTPLEDSGTWDRVRDRATASYRAATRRVNDMTRRSARPDGYHPDDEITSLRERTAQYGAGPYRPDGYGGSPGPGGPRRPARPPRRRGDKRDPRAFYYADGTPVTGVDKALRRLWYGRWWRHWSFKKVGLLFGGTAAFVALALVASFFVVYSATKVPLVALSKPLTQSSIVEFANGKEVGCFCTAGRFILTENQVKSSKYMWEAVLAAEDRAYFTEGGISITGLIRAIKNDLSGGSIQGGSTITEQFVKTYYNPVAGGNLSYSQKFKEIFVAIKLAKLESKWWILTHYLNAIPLGSGANGIEAAAETYFHRKAWQLTLGQAAMIAALVQSPYGYDPMDPTSTATGLSNTLLDRWVYVLTNMVRDNAITQAQFSALVPDPSTPGSKANLQNFPKVRINSVDSNWSGYRGYIMQLVYNELVANYHMPASIAQIGNMGLTIKTTISKRLMDDLYATVAAEKHQMAADAAAGNGVPLPNYIHISAVLEKPGSGKILAFYGGPGFGAKHCNQVHCQLDTILTGEPVGSSFKPYVLATAVAKGMDVRKSVMNSHSPLCIPPDWTQALRMQIAKSTLRCDTPNGYTLFNEGGENYGQNLTVPEATAVSNDPAFEDLAHRTSVQSVINMAQTLGVSSYDVTGLNDLFGDHCLKHHPSCTPGAVQAALGEGSLTAVDQANTFSVLVSGGTLVTPHVIDYVLQNGARLPASNVVHTQALQPAVAADTDFALSFDTTCQGGNLCGTGVPNAQWPGRPMIAKTGTLGSGAFASQAWFLGAIPQYSLAVGMFTDHPNYPNGQPHQILDVLPSRPSWSGGFGGAWPATIWQAFMSTYMNNLPVKQLPTPSYTGTDPLFTKWILALPVKKKHKCQQPGPGKHHHLFLGGGQGPNCQNGNGNGNGNGTPSPHPTSPSPHPTSPSPHPTPTTSGPTPPPSTSLPPIPGGTHGAAALPGLTAQVVPVSHRHRAPWLAIAAMSLAAVAILPTKLVLRSRAR